MIAKITLSVSAVLLVGSGAVMHAEPRKPMKPVETVGSTRTHADDTLPVARIEQAEANSRSTIEVFHDHVHAHAKAAHDHMFSFFLALHR